MEPTTDAAPTPETETVPVTETPIVADEPVAPVTTLNNWKRDERGLLEGVEYVYNEDGSVNWLAMIPKEYFVINKQATTETDVSKVDDKHKLILLMGFKYLADLRGYLEETTDVVTASPDYVATSTSIRWMPNFEKNMCIVTRSGKADAWRGNVSTKAASNGFVATNFLMATSENRSFVRAVKNFLKITILGQDEVSGPAEDTSSGSSAAATDADGNKEARKNLQKVLDGAVLSFENFKNAMTKHVADGRIKDINAETWETINDIPSEKLFEVTNFLEQRLKAKRTQS